MKSTPKNLLRLWKHGVQPISLATRRVTLCAAPGFTLVEILISISIVTVVVGLLYGTFRSTIETSEQLDQEANPFRLSRLVFYQITRDISMSIHPKAATASASNLNTDSSFALSPLKGENRSHFMNESYYPNDSITFPSLATPPVLQGFSEWRQANISYSLSGSVLTRKVQYVDRAVENEVAESVLGLDLRYFDGKKQEWADEWNSEEQKENPQAIEVILILKESDESPERRLQTRVEIPSPKSL
ncbi:MAG: type II secretion system protein GspJ [Nitrospirota bacterium]